MEASFRSRIDRTFGFLDNAESDGETHLWNVEGRAQSKKNKGLSREEGDSDDENASGFADFLKPGNGKQEGRSNASFFGEDDLEELDSGDEDEDVEEQMRVAKKVARGHTELKSGGEGGPSEPSKQDEDEDDDDDEVREVREMVGMDDTLDLEDEEDEYDRVAVGTEGTDDRLFMSRVRNFGANRQQLNPLPTNFIEMRQARSDRRANHKTALARLEEDDLEAATRAAEELSQATEEFKLEIVEEPKMVENMPIRQDNGGEAMDIDGDGDGDGEGSQHRISKVEPITGARDEPKKPVAGNLESCRVSEGKPRNSGKRVRFLMDETSGAESNAGRPDQTALHGGADDAPSTATTTTAVHSIVARSDRYSKVPDYVKNPSKYIHYTLDWSEEDEESANVAAFHAARAVSSSSTQDMEGAPLESQGPSGSTKISFNPLVKRRPKESGRDASNGVLINGVVNIAANFDVDSGQLGGIITMEDDQGLGPSSVKEKSGRVVRRYRNRTTDDIETN